MPTYISNIREAIYKYLEKREVKCTDKDGATITNEVMADAIALCVYVECKKGNK